MVQLGRPGYNPITYEQEPTRQQMAPKMRRTCAVVRMSRRRTHESTVRGAIRRLRALALEIDRAVEAAARVRRDIQRSMTATRYPALITKRG